MTLEQNKATVRRLYDDIWNKRRLAVVDEIYSPGIVYRAPRQEVRGRDALKKLVQQYMNAFADSRMTFDRVLAEGDTVLLHWTFNGVHKGELFGAAPTGRTLTLSGMTVDRLVEGKVVEEWEVFDELGLRQQIGLVPEPAGVHV